MFGRVGCFLVAFGMLAAAPIAKSETIDVIFYYDTVTFANFGGAGPAGDIARLNHAQSVLNDMELAMTQSGLASFEYRVAHVSQDSFVWGGFASPAVELAIDPATTADRNTYYADVAIVILDPPGAGFGACGEGAKPDSVSLLNREDFAYIALDLLCQFAFEHLAAHEMGHVLAADHEIADDPDSLNLAERYNHAHIDSVNELQTIMASGEFTCGSNCDTRNQYSDPWQNFAATGIAAGDEIDSDVVRLIDNDDSFWTVARYRNPPPPSCEIDVAWVCENDSPRAIVTPTLAGYTMTNIDLDYRLSGSSNWYPIYDGAPTCPLYNPPSTFMNSIVNALVTTAAGYVTGCTVTAVPIWCGNGDPL